MKSLKISKDLLMKKRNIALHKNRGCRALLIVGLSVASLVNLPSSVQGEYNDPSTQFFNLNSGFNSTVFVTRYFDRKTDYAQLQKELSVGEYLQRPTDLGAIKKALESAGLRCMSVSAPSLQDMIDLVGSDTSAILHRNATSGPRFIVLYKAKSQWAVFAYPYPLFQGDKDAVVRTFGNDIDSVLLITSDPKRSLEIADGTHLPPQSIAATSLSSPQGKDQRGSLIVAPLVVAVDESSQYGGTITARATIRNEGKQSLEIQDVSEACSCFKQMIGSRIITPGGATDAVFVFGEKEFDQVAGTTVILRSNDTVLPSCAIHFAVSRNRPLIPRIVTLGRTIAVGRLEGADLSKQDLRFFLLIDAAYGPGITLNEVHFDSSVLSVRTEAAALEISGLQLKGYVLRVNVEKLDSAEVVQTITVTTTHPIDKEICFTLIREGVTSQNTNRRLVAFAETRTSGGNKGKAAEQKVR